MKIYKKFLLLFTTLCSVCSIVNAAAAAELYGGFTQNIVGLYLPGGTYQQGDGSLSASLSANGVLTDQDNGENSSWLTNATASSTFSAGKVGASIFGNASIAQSETSPFVYSVSGGGNSQAYWFDTITFSSIDPNVQFVDFLLLGQLEADISGGIVTAGFAVDGIPRLSLTLNSTGFVADQVTISLGIGATVPIFQNIVAEAGAGVNAPYGTGGTVSQMRFASALNTSSLGLQVLTPGVSYTTASGFVYPTSFDATPVPEPSTLPGLAFIGIVGGILVSLKHYRKTQTSTKASV